jgi:hypothetical protein
VCDIYSFHFVDDIIAKHDFLPLIIPCVSAEIPKILAIPPESLGLFNCIKVFKCVENVVAKIFLILEKASINAILNELINARILISEAGKLGREHINNFHG